MQNSNEIKSSLITSEFLRFLLQNNVQGSIPDFILLSIKNIFLFPNIKKNPFKRTCTYLKDILNTQKTNTPLISTLKIVANSYCGILAYQKNKNGATHILRHSEIQSLLWKPASNGFKFIPPHLMNMLYISQTNLYVQPCTYLHGIGCEPLYLFLEQC